MQVKDSLSHFSEALTLVVALWLALHIKHLIRSYIVKSEYLVSCPPFSFNEHISDITFAGGDKRSHLELLPFSKGRL